MGDIDWASHSIFFGKNSATYEDAHLDFSAKTQDAHLDLWGAKIKMRMYIYQHDMLIFTKIKISIFAKKSTCWLSHLPRVYFGSSIPLSVAMCQPCPRWDPLDILDEIAEKRMHVLEGTKRGRAYRDMQQACENDESLRRPSTPDPHRVQSKRTWETSMFRWREEIRSVNQIIQKTQDY